MAARGLLQHSLQAIADPRPSLRSTSSLSPSHRAYAFRCSLSSSSSPIFAKAIRSEDQVLTRDSPPVMLQSSDTEAVEFVNHESPGPMVEVDPVTVFRRIIAERREGFAMARARQQAEDAAAMQLAGTYPFSIGRRLSGKSAIAIALAMILLLLAAIALLVRSRTGNDKQGEPISVEENNKIAGSADSEKKLVDDSIQAPESILTAMTIGAASVGRLKGPTGSSYDTVNGTNGNVVGTQGLDKSEPIMAEDTRTEGHGAHSFGQMSYNASSVEPMDTFKAQDVGVDVTEGPWFSQADVDDAESLDSSNDAASASQVTVLNEMMAANAFDEIPETDVVYTTPPLSDFVDGEFLGEVVSASVITEDALGSENSPQIESFQFEELEDGVALGSENSPQIESFQFEELEDGVPEDSSVLLEKLEQAIQQESIPLTEDGSMVKEINESEQDDLSEGHATLMETNTNVDNALSAVADYERDEEHKAAHPFVSLDVDKVASMDTSDVENKYDDSLDGRVPSTASFDPMAAGLLHGEQQNNASMMMTHQDSGALIGSSTADVALDSSDARFREMNEKALEAAVPALSVGVGTIGTLLGVAGGLQVVGFAALTNLISRDFFWAENRVELWKELKAINSREKLRDFLAKRNILRTDEEEASL